MNMVKKKTETSAKPSLEQHLEVDITGAGKLRMEANLDRDEAGNCSMSDIAFDADKKEQFQIDPAKQAALVNQHFQAWFAADPSLKSVTIRRL